MLCDSNSSAGKSIKTKPVKSIDPIVKIMNLAMSENDYALLERLIKASDKECFDIIVEQLSWLNLNISKDVVETLYIYASGHNVIFQAHVDTVRSEKEPVQLSRNGNIVTNKTGVLGADDRAGVFAAIKIAHRCRELGIKVPGLLFTAGEESGGYGMLQFIDDLGSDVKLKDEVLRYRIMIALDRKGCNDWVSYTSLPDEVAKYVESFGFIRSSGAFSDSLFFTEETRTPHVNVSVGYYNQHTSHEMLHLDELAMTIERCILMASHPPPRKYKVSAKKYHDYYDVDWDLGLGGGGVYRVSDKRGFNNDYYWSDRKVLKSEPNMIRGLSEDVWPRKPAFNDGRCQYCGEELNFNGYCPGCGTFGLMN